MKNNLLFLIIALVFTSCTTNYYTVILNEDTNLYQQSNESSLITTIPKDTKVYLSNKSNKKNYKKIKWANHLGWAYNPNYTSYSSYIPTSNSTPTSSYYNYSSSTSSKSSGGSVQVKGYTRKDGTYVRPHTRSAPKRR